MCVVEAVLLFWALITSLAALLILKIVHEQHFANKFANRVAEQWHKLLFHAFIVFALVALVTFAMAIVAGVCCIALQLLR